MSNLTNLNNHLFQQLGRLNDPNITEENLEKEIERSKAVTNLGKQIVSGAKLQLEVLKLKAEYSGLRPEEMPDMLEAPKKTDK